MMNENEFKKWASEQSAEEMGGCANCPSDLQHFCYLCGVEWFRLRWNCSKDEEMGKADTCEKRKSLWNKRKEG